MLCPPPPPRPHYIPVCVLQKLIHNDLILNGWSLAWNTMRPKIMPLSILTFQLHFFQFPVVQKRCLLGCYKLFYTGEISVHCKWISQTAKYSVWIPPISSHRHTFNSIALNIVWTTITTGIFKLAIMIFRVNSSQLFREKCWIFETFIRWHAHWTLSVPDIGMPISFQDYGANSLWKSICSMSNQTLYLYCCAISLRSSEPQMLRYIYWK